MGRDCIARIVEASRGFNHDKEALFSEREAKNLLDELNSAVLKRVRDGGNWDDALSAEILSRKVAAKTEGVIQKRNALINITKDKEIASKIDNYVAGGLTPREAMQAILVGVSKNVEEGKFSVDAKYKQLHAKYFGYMTAELEKSGLLPLVNQKTMQKQIENELWQLSLKDGKAGVSGSKEAQQIAKIIHETNEAMRIRQNKAGAAIDKLDGFTATQTHDVAEMRKAGYEKWRNAIVQRLDQDRTFKGADAEKFLKSSYEALSTGIHLRATGADDGKLFEFKGAANLAKKVSQQRIFHFKSAEDARAYRNEFGRKDFMEGVLSNIEHSSRNIALMETFGTNPGAMFDKVLQDTKAKYRNDPEKIKSIMNDRMLRNFYKEIDGTTRMVESPSLAMFGSAFRAQQSLAKMGGVMLSSINDLATKAAELSNQGHNLLHSYGISFADIGAHLANNSERKQLYSAIGVGLEGMLGHIGSRFSATDDLPGTMTKLQRLMFKANGLSWWTDANKAGTGLAMSHRLAQFKDTGFDALDGNIKRIFNQYGIGEKEWELIRQSATKQLDGNHYITPDAIHDLPNNLFGKNAEAEKNLLEGKLQSYFIDRTDTATLTPGARETAILNQGTKRGTVEGELLRFFAQFKAFPVSMLTKVYGNVLYGKGKLDVPAMVHLALMSTIFGYAAMTAKDLAKGLTPRDPSKAATWGQAFTQGGGAGIYGDYIMGEYNRFGHDLLTTAAGPAFSTLSDVAKLYASSKSDAADLISGKNKVGDPRAEALNTLMNNVPFANLFYIRPALNYMGIYQLQEHLNPGYLRRMERRVEKQNNQHFIIKPSSTIR
jgi:hypothetical protein